MGLGAALQQAFLSYSSKEEASSSSGGSGSGSKPPVLEDGQMKALCTDAGLLEPSGEMQGRRAW